MIIVIIGCTGVGKTKLSIMLGEKFGGEILNTDAMQLYNGLDIITNKATVEEQSRIPHHLLGILPPHVQCNVFYFQKEAHRVVDDLLARDIVPILVGGTNYYTERAVAVPMQFHPKPPQLPKNTPTPHEMLSPAFISSQEAFDRLRSVDPQMAERLHPNDHRKILRSLEVFETSGKRHSDSILSSSHQPTALRHSPCLFFWIDCEQSELDQRLDKRVDAMLDMGLLREVYEHFLFVSSYPSIFTKEISLKKDSEGTKVEWEFERGVLQSIGFKEFQPLFEYTAGEHGFPNLECCREDKSRCCMNKMIIQHEDCTIGNACSDVTCCKIDDKLWADFFELFCKNQTCEAMLTTCVNTMKQHTRRYARKQTQWIRNRICTAREGLFVYRLDASSLATWEEDVFDVAAGIVQEALDSSKPPPSNVEMNPFLEEGQKLKTWKKHFCDKCNQTLNGDCEWKVHLKSRKHRKGKKKTHQEVIPVDDSRVEKKYESESSC
eukprot:m.93283 g.93283  ORF g.93283 m.93283 type:complete len:492 (-) comp8909_c0_seq2:2079-3554(-)